MPFKRQAGDLGSSFLLGFRKTWRLKTWTLKSIETMQGELLALPLKVKSGELSRYKTKQHWDCLFWMTRNYSFREPETP